MKNLIHKPIQKPITIGFRIIFLAIISINQAVGQHNTDSIMFKAMDDEMKRNMDELKLEGHDKPFYIRYYINDTKSFSTEATLGAILQSGVTNNKSKGVRVIVGDYAFNDESLDISKTNSFNGSRGGLMPKAVDYYGIRHALWQSTDAIYRSAAKQFKANQQYVEEQDKPLKEIPHRRFVKMPSVQLEIDRPEFNVDETKWKDYTRTLSAAFKEFDNVTNSSISLNYHHTTHYFLNSEGTKVIYPSTITYLSLHASIKSESGESFQNSIVKYASTPDKLPSIANMKKEINSMMEKLYALKAAPIFRGEYEGPVLYVGKAAPEAFYHGLFSFGDNLVTSTEIKKEEKNTFGGSTAIEDKTGKKVINENITVKSLPKLKLYESRELLGSYVVDAEGVIPMEELTLIENGKLRTLLNTRTAIRDDHKPNGHAITATSVGPGVLSVSTKKGMAYEELKLRLIEEAKDEGLDFAVIVKNANNTMYSGGTEFYGVSLQDGSEQLIRSARLNTIKLKHLNDIIATSSNSVSVNFRNRNGSITSVIAPDAVLFEDIEIEAADYSSPSDEASYISNPLNQ